MTARLIYVVGPSGAGKDSLLHWLRKQLPATSPVHWVRRTITRAPEPSGEDHECVDEETFNDMLNGKKFALHWDANELRYGVRHSELVPLSQAQWVFLNGSRAQLENTAQQYPGMTVLHITADPKVLKKRLEERGRENTAAIKARMLRSIQLRWPPNCRIIEVHNNDSLPLAGIDMLQQLRQLDDWPA
jgi:ribose 1,5-bisphosphokinase